MTKDQKEGLVRLARENIKDDDPSHDYWHALRIMKLAELIAAEEGGDPDIVVPAALFHDVIIYPKDDPRSPLASVHSADLARRLLAGTGWYPPDKIEAVAKAIERCSFSKALPKERIEEHILQDADLLESLGAIAVARTFSSSGQMRRRFYDPDDPRAERRQPVAKGNALDLFPVRLFQAAGRLHTAAAKKMAVRREAFLHVFYAEFLKDIE